MDMDITPATRKGEMILRRHLLPADINDVIIEPGAMYFLEARIVQIGKIDAADLSTECPRKWCHLDAGVFVFRFRQTCRCPHRSLLPHITVCWII